MAVMSREGSGVELLRSAVIKNSLVIRGPRGKVDYIQQTLEEDLGYSPRILSEVLLGGERSVQLHLKAEDWSRVPPLSQR